MKNNRQVSSKRAKARKQNRNQVFGTTMLVAAGVIVLLLAAAFSIGQAEVQNIQPARIGSRISDFSLTDISGRELRLSDFKGKVVLLNAWATWCPPCRAEMPDLNAYYQQHAADGFVILAVNAGETVEEAAAFAQDYGLTFPVLLDPQVNILTGLNIRSFPTSIVIGRDGIVKDIHIGMLTPELIEEKVGLLLQQETD